MPMVVGAPLLLLLFAASAFPWLLVLRARFGQLIAVPATAGGALFLLLAVLTVSHLLGINYIAALVVASIVVGVLGAIVAARTPDRLRRPGRYAVALWCPALLGAAVWIATGIASQLAPGASRFGWVMNGDALNNLGFADILVRDNGITVVQSTYAVPLSTALIAVGLGSGSPSSGEARAVLEQHLAAFALVWVLLLAVLCVAMGVVCASLIPRHLTRVVATISALGSLLPLTWFVTGLGVQWGYFNVDVVLPIMLAAWLVYLNSQDHPFVALFCLVGFAVLAVATWTPIAFLIVALGVALAIRHVGQLRRPRTRYLALLVAAVLVTLTCVFGVVDYRALFDTHGPLDATGSGYTGFVNLWWAVPILFGLLVVATIAVRRRTTLPTTSGAVALFVAGALTSALLVYLASGNGELFGGYYPKKFAWILILLFGIIILSFLIGSFASRVRLGLLAAIVVLALFGSVVLPPGTWPEVVQRQPVVRILGDYVRHDGEATVREILKLTTASHSTVLWQSGDPDEPIINEWLLLSHGGLANGDPKLIFVVGTPYFFYRTSGRYTDLSITTLCKILPLLHGKRVVVTANPSVESQLRATCPNAPATVRVTTELVGPLPSKTGENWQSDGIEGPFR
jgi:hypothetical protein